jgi:hypothetical protein
LAELDDFHAAGFLFEIWEIPRHHVSSWLRAMVGDTESQAIIYLRFVVPNVLFAVYEWKRQNFLLKQFVNADRDHLSVLWAGDPASGLMLN